MSLTDVIVRSALSSGAFGISSGVVDARTRRAKKLMGEEDKDSRTVSSLRIGLVSGALYTALQPLMVKEGENFRDYALESLSYGAITGSIGYVLGELAYNGIKHFKDKKDRKIVEKIRANPERAIDYIPERRKLRILGSLDSLEEELFRDEIDKQRFEKTEKNLEKSVSAGLPLYIQEIATWVKGQIKEIGERRASKSLIKKFYETDTGILVFGEPQKTSLVLARVGEREIKEYSLDLSDIKIRFQRGGVSFSNESPKMEEKSIILLPTDYRLITRKVADAKKEGQGVVIISLPEGESQEDVKQTIKEICLQSYVLHEGKKLLANQKRMPRPPSNPELN